MDVQEDFSSIPDEIDLQWVQSFHSRLKTAIEEQRPLEEVLPEDAAACILARVGAVLDKEATVLSVEPKEGHSVIVVGDTHGQFLDVMSMLNATSAYAGGKYYIFNGDLVDRGSWGVELFLSVAVLKLADPNRYIILRGNHESNWCTKMYGFKKELESKYPHKRRPQAGVRKLNIGSFIKVFKLMPLAAVVLENTLVLHGGLWRRPAAKKRKAGAAGRRAAAKCAKRSQQQGAQSGGCSADADWMPSTGSGSNKIVLGTLQDLRNSGKGGADPLGQYSTNTLATDVLWSDPVREPGLASNDSRGVGLLFGPDVTNRFLEAHSLKMIVRSHEGPDARFGREDMLGMDSGFTLDHDTESGKLVTIFSAPDYPQHQAGDERFDNKASVLELKAPSYAEYDVITYGAVPRPPATCFYDLDIPGSDDELNIGAASDDGGDVSKGFASSVASSVNGSGVDDAAETMDAEEVSGSLQAVPQQDPVAKDSGMDLGPGNSAAAVQNHSIPTSATLNSDCMFEAEQLEDAAPNSCAAAASADALVEKAPESDAGAEDDSEHGDMDASGELQESVVGYNVSSAAIACAVVCESASA